MAPNFEWDVKLYSVVRCLLLCVSFLILQICMLFVITSHFIKHICFLSFLTSVSQHLFDHFLEEKRL